MGRVCNAVVAPFSMLSTNSTSEGVSIRQPYGSG
jgi:hypothetical protein